jgi:modulator of FtsH protease
MNQDLHLVQDISAGGSSAAQRNRVLRNTYGLLALSMVPTVLGAWLGAAGVFFAMATLASVIKRDLSGMGKFLMIGAVVVFAVGLINFFFQSTALMLTLSAVCIALFSAFMLYDIKRVIDGGETNYISATLAIYLDIYNVFQNLLVLLGVLGGERD